MFVDGYDSLLLADETEIREKFLNSDHSLVISCEVNCFPADLRERFPAAPSRSKYVNSGGMIGRAGYFKWIIAQVLDLPVFPEYPWSNQYRWTRFFLENKSLMKLDNRCDLFYSAATPQEERDTSKWRHQQSLFRSRQAIYEHPPFLEEEFRRVLDRMTIRKGRIECKATATWPCVLHFNGPGSALMKYKEAELSALRPWESGVPS